MLQWRQREEGLRLASALIISVPICSMHYLGTYLITPFDDVDCIVFQTPPVPRLSNQLTAAQLTLLQMTALTSVDYHHGPIALPPSYFLVSPRISKASECVQTLDHGVPTRSISK